MLHWSFFSSLYDLNATFVYSQNCVAFVRFLYFRASDGWMVSRTTDEVPHRLSLDSEDSLGGQMTLILAMLDPIN